MKADVFISYAVKDQERVLELVGRLRQAGVSVWIDQSGIDVATLWSEEIVNAIANCKVLLLAISQNSIESANVVKELALASERSKHIIPIYLQPARIPGTMEYQLAGIQRVEFFSSDDGAAVKAILRSLIKFGVNISEAALSELGKSQYAQTESKSKSNLQKQKPVLLISAGVIAALLGFFIFLKNDNKPDELNGGKTIFLSNKTKEAEQISPPTEEATLENENRLSLKKLVILPFKLLSKGQNDFLSEGMTMELISKLQPISGLTVIASNSAMKFANSALSAKEIGYQLNAGSIVQGTIQQGNENLKIIVNLVNANTEEVNWSKAFSGSIRNILNLQAEIAKSVASELELVLTAEEIARVTKKSTEIPEAYDEYLQGRIEWKKRSKQSLDKAVEHFKSAIKKDPNFALAYSGLADIYVIYPYWQIESPQMALPKARENAEKAISLDPLLAEAWNNLAFVESHYFNWKKAKENFEKAVELNRNYPTAWHWRNAVLMRMGVNTEERIKCAKKAYELDPKYAELSSGMAHVHMSNEDYEEALWFMDNAYKLSNNENKIYKAITAEICYRMGASSKGIEIIQEHFGRDLLNNTQALVALALCYSKEGNSGKCYELLSTLFHILLTKDRYIPEDNIADIYAELGDKEKTIFWIKRGINNFSSNATLFTSKPVYRKWAEEPEFIELRKQVGLSL
ncbi:MAG: TIR domain-containing protein [Verrucomicrobiae bacterium]|nr:TIR domain-containing protein [Verrucomicrobiae bacterium]